MRAIFSNIYNVFQNIANVPMNVAFEMQVNLALLYIFIHQTGSTI